MTLAPHPPSPPPGSRQGSAGGLSGGGFVVLGIDHQAATHAFALAFSMQVGFIAERKVDNAALAGRHRAELIRRPGTSHFFGGDGGGSAEFLNALRTLVLTVEA